MRRNNTPFNNAANTNQSGMYRFTFGLLLAYPAPFTSVGYSRSIYALASVVIARPTF